MLRRFWWGVTLLMAMLLTGLVGAGQAAAAPDAVVVGKVMLQGRTTYADTIVYYDGVPYSRTSANGEFALAVGNGGYHVLQVKHPGYLSRETTIENPAGLVSLPPTTLLMGDANGDDSVNFADLYILTLAYNTSPPSDPRADFNADGRVDAADLAGMMGNYNKSGPLPWQDAPPPPPGLNWSSRAPLPTARFNLGVAELGGKVYAVGGEDGGVLGSVLAFDPASGTWQPRASLPTPRAGLAVAAVDGKLYAIGGNAADGSRLGTVEAYDPATDTWASRAPMPTRRAYLGAAALGGRILAVGGYDYKALNVVEVYDPDTNRWQSAAPMPTARFGLGVAPFDGGLLAVGGWGNLALATAEIYDPLINAWTETTPMPAPRANVAAAAVGGLVLAVGGWNGGPLATVEAAATTAP